MALLELRRRGSTFLFFVVVVAHIVLISAQVTSKSGVPVLQAVTFGLVAQVQRAGAAVIGGVSSFWGGYVDLRGLRTENAQLKSDLAATKLLLQQERALAQRTDALAHLLDLKTRTPLETLASEVIAGPATPEFRTITIGNGTASGLRPDMAVLAPNGVVGRIIVPSARASKVQLLIDRNAAAGALVERSRAQGVALGEGDSTMRLDFVNSTADIRIGDTIVTSGIDGIYPKGFVIGKVERLERSGGSFRNIQVQPAVDFTMLEDVLVVLTPSMPDSKPAAELEGAPVPPHLSASGDPR
jgi:rod shape-determining protein MreC